MNKRESEVALDALVDRHFDFLTRLNRIPCPKCQIMQSLVVVAEGPHIRVRCVAPIPRNQDEDYAYCYAEWVYHAQSTSVLDLPEPRFMLQEPKQRTTTTRKAKTK